MLARVDHFDSDERRFDSSKIEAPNGNIVALFLKGAQGMELENRSNNNLDEIIQDKYLISRYDRNNVRKERESHIDIGAFSALR